ATWHWPEVLQVTALEPTHAPLPLHASVCVQRLPSVHDEPSARGGFAGQLSPTPSQNASSSHCDAPLGAVQWLCSVAQLATRHASSAALARSAQCAAMQALRAARSWRVASSPRAAQALAQLASFAAQPAWHARMSPQEAALPPPA